MEVPVFPTEIQIPKTKAAQQEGPSAHRETEKFTATQYSE